MRFTTVIESSVDGRPLFKIADFFHFIDLYFFHARAIVTEGVGHILSNPSKSYSQSVHKWARVFLFFACWNESRP